jgi:hypothetical protein
LEASGAGWSAARPKLETAYERFDRMADIATRFLTIGSADPGVLLERMQFALRIVGRFLNL